MSSAKSKPLGLQTRLMIWSSVVLAGSFGAGFLWVHHGLKAVLEAKNEASLERKGAELV